MQIKHIVESNQTNPSNIGHHTHFPELPIKSCLRWIVTMMNIFLLSCNSGAIINTTDSVCDSYLKRYASSSRTYRLTENGRVVSGTIGSLVVGGGIAIGETLLYVSGGILIASFVCLPVLMIETAINDSDDADAYETSSLCLSTVASQAVAAFVQEDEYSLTGDFWNQSSSWRNYRYDEQIVFLLESIECRLEQGRPQDLVEAQRQMGIVKSDKAALSGVSQFTLQRITKLEQGLLQRQNEVLDN